MAVHSLNCFTHKFVSLAKMMVCFQEIDIKIVGKFVLLEYSNKGRENNMKQSCYCNCSELVLFGCTLLYLFKIWQYWTKYWYEVVQWVQEQQKTEISKKKEPQREQYLLS